MDPCHCKYVDSDKCYYNLSVGIHALRICTKLKPYHHCHAFHYRIDQNTPKHSVSQFYLLAPSSPLLSAYEVCIFELTLVACCCVLPPCRPPAYPSLVRRNLLPHPPHPCGHAAAPVSVAVGQSVRLRRRWLPDGGHLAHRAALASRQWRWPASRRGRREREEEEKKLGKKLENIMVLILLVDIMHTNRRIAVTLIWYLMVHPQHCKITHI